MITLLNQSYVGPTSFLLLFLSITLQNFISAMQKSSEEKAIPTNSSTTRSWLNSIASSLCNRQPKLGFYKQPSIYDIQGKEDLELLEKALRGEIPLETEIKFEPLPDRVLTSVNAATLAYFIEHGIQLHPCAIMRLSWPDNDDPQAQRIEKLKLLLRAGFDVNYFLKPFIALGSVFHPDKYDCSSYNYILPSTLPYTSFEYHCSYAMVLLNAGADPNLPGIRNETCFNVLLEAIVRLGKQDPDKSEPDFLLNLNRKIQAFRDKSYPLETEKLIVKAFLACGADYNKVSEETRSELETRKPYIVNLISSFETDKAALFVAIDEQNFENVKALAQRLPFKVKNAAGDTPLHHAVRNPNGKSDQTWVTLDTSAQKSKNIIILLLRVLPQLSALKNSQGETPVQLIFPKSKFWMLRHCFLPAANPHPKPIADQHSVVRILKSIIS